MSVLAASSEANKSLLRAYGARTSAVKRRHDSARKGGEIR
jgi:hypothetical protein